MKSLYESILGPDVVNNIKTSVELIKEHPSGIAVYKNLMQAKKDGKEYKVLMWIGKGSWLTLINELIRIGEKLNPTKKNIPKHQAILVVSPKYSTAESNKVDKNDYVIYYKSDNGKWHMLCIWPTKSTKFGEMAYAAFGDKAIKYWDVASPVIGRDDIVYALPDAIKHVMDIVEK